MGMPIWRNFVSYPNISVVYQPSDHFSQGVWIYKNYIGVSIFITPPSTKFINLNVLFIHSFENLFDDPRNLNFKFFVWNRSIQVEKSYVATFLAFVSHCFKILWTLSYPKQIVTWIIFNSFTINLMSFLYKF